MNQNPTPESTRRARRAAEPAEVALQVSDLEVDFVTKNRTVNAVRGVSFEVNRGEVLAVVGESGSGKTITSLAALGLLPSTARTRGSLQVAGHQVLGSPDSMMDTLRGNVVSMVFQEPMTALNPSMKIGAQIAEAILNHTEASKAQAHERAVSLLEKVGIPDPASKARNYPHQLSGGQRQRVVIAIALACNPAVIIADEPTTALDVTVQAEILELLRQLVRETNTALVLITHNMGVVADLADRVVVMKSGLVVESGPAFEVLRTPTDPYTQALLAAVPKLPQMQLEQREVSAPTVPDAQEAPRRAAGEEILVMGEVCVDFTSGTRKIRAVDHAELVIHQNQIVGLVGESGSGKSTLGRVPLGLVPLSSGRVELFGQDISGLSRRALRRLRSRLGIIFQDPGGSLDPRMTLGDSIAEPMIMHRKELADPGRGFRERRVAELIDAVRLPKDTALRYPHELSGGQRQRIGLARALALAPKLLIADEPTSALDVSVQDEVLTLLLELQQEHGFGCLFISHDLAVVHSVCDSVSVMRQGQVLESGPAARVLTDPQQDYTRQLLASVPSPDPEAQALRRQARRELLALGSEGK
ncbi:ABC transporter ATP-binding protein [Glutamicibacter creatinolyticus]|uniref:ABC transporter ATP-binding protein n=1 Tax=Glutamicibacter creatinolyticus TaxID=162496 RepID=UPI0031D088D7